MSLMKLFLFALSVQIGYTLCCDCEDITAVKNLFLKQLIDQMNIVSRLDRLESAKGTDIVAKPTSDQTTVDALEGRLRDLERLFIALNGEMITTREEWKRSKMILSKIQQVNLAFMKAWKLQKMELSDLKRQSGNKSIELHDLRVELDKFNTKTDQLLNELDNKTSGKLTALQNKVESFVNEIDEISNKTRSELAALQTEVDSFVNETKNRSSKVEDTFRQLLSEHSDLERFKSEVTNSLTNLRRKTSELRWNVSFHGIAFTAYGSKYASSYIIERDTISFDTVILNEGGLYKTDWGVFIVPKYGLYYFAVTLTKIRGDIDMVTAYLCAGKKHRLRLHSDPDDPGTTDYGSYSISAAGTFRLYAMEMVYVKGPSSHFYDDNRSFFTGFGIA